MVKERPGLGRLMMILLLAAIFPLPAETDQNPQKGVNGQEQASAWIDQALEITNAQSGDRDLRKAFLLLKKGAELNDPRAQYYLGLAYYNGEGVVKNYRKAYFWFTLASARSYPAATLSLEQCEEYLSADELDLIRDQVSKWEELHAIQ